MTTLAYFITDWESRYEVSEKGTAYKSGDKKRAKLQYVRLAVHGKNEGIGWKKLRRAAGDEFALLLFGLFCKLLELAADQEREFRGYLLDEKRQPASPEYMEIIWGIPQSIIEKYLPKLAEIGWIEKKMLPCEVDSSDGFGSFPKNSESAQDNEFRKIPNPSESTPLTETETEQNITKTITEPKAPEGFRQNKDFVSPVSASGVRNKVAFLMRLVETLHISANSSDHTAFQNLADYLDSKKAQDPGIFEDVLCLASEKVKCPTLKNPIAVFFAAVNKKYGFCERRAI